MLTCIMCGRTSSDTTRIAGVVCVSTWGCGGYAAIAAIARPKVDVGASMDDPAYEWPIDIVNIEGRAVLICAAPFPPISDSTLELGVRHGTCGAVVARSFTLHELVENLRHHIATVAHDLEVDWGELMGGYEKPPVYYASTAATFSIPPGITVTSSGYASGGIIGGAGGTGSTTFSGFTEIAGSFTGTIPASWTVATNTTGTDERVI